MLKAISGFRARLAALLLTAALPLGFAALAAEPGVEPLSLRTVPVTPGKLPPELEAAKPGAFVEMPLAEFEQLRAAMKKAAAKKVPRLIEARYRATLQTEPALAGTGQWKIINPADGPALLPLLPLNLALRQARFENARDDAKPDALLAEFDGRTPALLLDQPGVQAVALDWSARADARPEGLYFTLEFPPAPVSVLELNLPADHVVSTDLGVALSGPHPAEKEDRRLWQISCSNKPGVGLWVRRAADAANTPPLVFVRQHTTQKLTPEGMEATFAFDLDAPRPGVRLLEFEFDADLRPCDITAPNLESSQLIAGTPGQPSRLLLRLREPLPAGTETVTIRCQAPLGSPVKNPKAPLPEARQLVAWTSPAMRMLRVGSRENAPNQAGRAVLRGETLEVLAHPTMRLEGWQSGAFHLTETRTEGERPTAFQWLKLVGGGVELESGRRPSARLQAGGVEFRARQFADWRAGAEQSSLRLQIAYEVSHGHLFQLPVQLPRGWDIESVETAATHPLRTWDVRQDSPEKGKALLIVDLQRPLTPDDARRDRATPLRLRTPTLTVRLHPVRPAGLVGREIEFPDAIPLGARFREGALAIEFDEQAYQPLVKASLPESEPEEDGPWARQTPDHHYAYRGSPVTGTLLLRPRPPQLRARCSSEVFLAAGRAAVETRVLVEAEAGTVETIDLLVSVEGDETPWDKRKPWEWRVEQGDNAIRRIEWLPAQPARDVVNLMALRQPLAMAALAGARPRGERWRITFARPLRLRSPLVLHAVPDLEAESGRWDVPLISVLNANRMEGEAILHLAGGDRIEIDAFGLREAPALSGSARGRAGPWRTFRYGEGSVALALRGKGRSSERVGVTVEDARQTTYLAVDGSLQVHFHFQATNCQQRTLPVTLPRGARPLAAQVDGHWLARLVVSEADGGGSVLNLPVPARDEIDPLETSHRFEVIYSLPGGETFPWGRIASPPPGLPGQPLHFRQTWRLPAGLYPLDESRYRRLPGGAGREPGYLAANFARRLPASVSRLGPQDRDEAATQAQALADAYQALRKERAGQTLPLHEVLEQVQIQAGPDVRGFVVDALALEEAGIGPRTLVKLQPPEFNEDQTPPWESLQLIALPGRSGPLLTSRRQWSVWPMASSGDLALPDNVESALAEAVANGHDSSARFHLALEWARPRDAGAASSRIGANPLTPVPALPDWAEWETLPGTDPAAAVVLIHGDIASATGAAGVALAALFLGVFLLLLLRSARLRLTFLLVWVGGAGIALAWLPPALRPLALWPLLAGCLVALGWYVLALRRTVSRKAPKTVLAAAGAAAGLFVLFFQLPETGQALPPPDQGPHTVYILPGPPDQPDKQLALLTPELLEQLRALARPSTPIPGGAVLLSAAYEGRIVDGVAEFDAVFQAFSLNKDAATLTIPLDGVRLIDDVWLDGARAFPTALAPPQTGYTLKLTDRGLHRIELRFRVAVTGAAEDRDVQFTGPRLLQNRLRMQLPPSATFVHGVTRHGAETLATTPLGKTLDVDLGRVTGPIHLHWFQEALPPQPVKVRYREAYLWDLRPDEPSLSGLVQFDVQQGNAATLDVQLPPELEVRGVEARRPTGGLMRLQSWRVRSGAGNERVLRLRFQSPLSGEVLIGLDLVPLVALASTTVLPLPTPQGSHVGEGGHLAYRVQGLEVQRSVQRLRPIKSDDFAPFWPEATRPNSATLTWCGAFRRDGGMSPVLRVQLQPQSSALSAVQDVRLRVDGRLARLRATVELTSPRSELSFAEWELQSPQPLTIASVTGAEVRNWSQAGNRLFVWLAKTSATANLEIIGWLPLAQPKEGPRFDLPCLRLLDVQSQQTTVRVAAATGLGVSPSGLRNLLPLPDQPASDPELVFTSKQPSYGGAFTVRPAVSSVEVQLLTFVEVVNRQVHFKTTLDYRIQRGELRTVQVRLRDWEGKDVQIEAAHLLRSPSERRRSLGDRTWTLELRPSFDEPFRATWGLVAGPSSRVWRHEGVTGTYRVTQSGSITLDDAAGGLPIPNVSVLDAARVERWLAVAGPDLSVEGVFGLNPVQDYQRSLSRWPGVANRLRHAGGQVWKAATAEGSLRLVPRDRDAVAAPIHVFLREHSAAVADNQRWLHEEVYWLRHEAHTDLNLTLPAAAKVVAVSLDGVEVPPLQPEPARVWLPLPGRAGVRCVRLRWIYDPPESLEAPRLEAPKLDGAEAGPCLWTIHVPPGFDAGAVPGGFGSGLPRAALADLRRAEAHVRITQQLVEQGGSNLTLVAGPLAAAQRRFADLSRQVERTLDAGGEGDATGPRGVSLREWLHQLRAQNRELAHSHGFEDLRVEAERPARLEPSPLPVTTEPHFGALAYETSRGGFPGWRGVPLYGVTEADAPGPRLQFTSERVRTEQSAWLATLPWLAALVVVGFLSFFPSVLVWARRFVPEQLALAGAVVWQFDGPLTLVLFLLLAAVLARLFGLIQWANALLRRPSAPATAKTSKKGSSVRATV